MTHKKLFSIAFAMAAMSLSATAFSSPPSSIGIGRDKLLGVTALRYRYYQDSDHDMVDVDGDQMSLRSLLDPPAAPWTSRPAAEVATSGGAAAPATTTTTTTRSIERRASPISELRSVEDYRERVLRELDDDPDRLCIVRFSAPWCKSCRATSVAWERMAAKITSACEGGGGERVRFFSVVVDGADGSPSAALKDMLGIIRVPQGIVHLPSRGVHGRKVDLDRTNLALLKKRLEAYALDVGTVMDFDGLKGGEDGGIA